MSGVYLTFLGLSSGPPPPIVLKKGIFAFGRNSSTVYSMSNRVSNVGVVETNTDGVGTARAGLAAASFGGDRAIFAFGFTAFTFSSNTNLSSPTLNVSTSNLVSNVGVVATNTINEVGTARRGLAAASFGGDRAIFAFGHNASVLSMSNLVSNTGVVGIDVKAVTGTELKKGLAACSYGGDKAIFAYGSTSNAYKFSYYLVSNIGGVAVNRTGAGTPRASLAASAYGDGQGIFAFGYDNFYLATSNLVSNVGAVATNTINAVGTIRSELAAASYG